VKAQQRFLDCVFGLRHGAQQPIGETHEARPQSLDLFGIKLRHDLVS
jgi:hypothetical protein